MTAWTDAVSAEFKNGRKTNPKFSLKMAMMKAKKSYRKMSRSSGKTSKIRGGGLADTAASYGTASPNSHQSLGTIAIPGPAGLAKVGGKKSRKSRKSSKKSKKN